MKMRTFNKSLIAKLILLLFLAMGSSSFAQTDTMCPDMDKIARIVSSDSMKIFTKRCNIPRKMKREWKKKIKEYYDWSFWNTFEDGFLDLRLANPGRPYNSGCIDDILYPNRQLVFGGKMKSYSFFVYCKGGLHRRRCFVFYDRKKSEIYFFWCSKIYNVEDLIKAIHERNVEYDKELSS